MSIVDFYPAFCHHNYATYDAVIHTCTCTFSYIFISSKTNFGSISKIERPFLLGESRLAMRTASGPTWHQANTTTTIWCGDTSSHQQASNTETKVKFGELLKLTAKEENFSYLNTIYIWIVCFVNDSTKIHRSLLHLHTTLDCVSKYSNLKTF